MLPESFDDTDIFFPGNPVFNEYAEPEKFFFQFRKFHL